MKARTVLAVSGIAFGTLLAFSAQATVDVTNVQLAGPGPYYTVDIATPGKAAEAVYDAALVLTIDGRQILANCDDIYHQISLGQTVGYQASPFTPAANPTNFDGGAYSIAQIGALDYFLDTSEAIWKAGPGGNPGEQAQLAALQLASWEIGNPQATFTNANSSVAALAQTYITDAAGAKPLDGVVQLSSSAGVQGQIIDVPEPAAWAMMLIGLGGVGGAMRARRKPAVA